LRELGIAAELGLSSLTIPKRLLKGKKNAKGSSAAYGVFFSPAIRCSNALFYPSAKSVEPPPPYPPPSPFVQLTVESVKSQIGLLRVYFEHRLTGLDSLPDDSPSPAQAKLGPLGQVIRPSSAAMAAAAGSKKKSKPKDAAAAAVAATVAPGTGATPVAIVGTSVAGTASAAGITIGTAVGMMSPATPVLSPQTASLSIVVSATSAAAAATPTTETQSQAQTPKKKKTAGAALGGAGGGAGAGAGAGGGGTGKKRGRPPEGLPPVVVASA
jgi:transcriptional activator SPT7